MTEVFFLNHQAPPEIKQLTASAPEVGPIEELRLPIGAVVMANRDLGEFIAGILKFLNHFEANCAGAGFECDVVKQRPTDQAKVTIDVSQLKAKRPFNQIVIGAADNLAVEGIIAGNFVAVGNVSV